MLAQQVIGGSVVRWRRFIVLDEVTEHRILFIIGRRLEREWPAGHLDHVLHLLGWHIQGLGQLLDAGLTAKTLCELMLYTQQFVDLVAHVYWHADRASLICNGTSNRLADPPGGVRGELMSAAVIELLGGADQADVALLDQIQKRNTAPHILLCHGDHEA